MNDQDAVTIANLLARLENGWNDLHTYNHYQPRSTQTAPMIGHIAGNTFGHYEEHLPWMQAIVAGS